MERGRESKMVGEEERGQSEWKGRERERECVKELDNWRAEASLPSGANGPYICHTYCNVMCKF